MTVTDPDGATVTQTVNVTVNPVNDAPKPTDLNQDSVTTPEDTPVEVVLDFEDPEGDDFTAAVTVGPQNGTFNTDTSTYTPNADFNGTDSFTYVVTDEFGASAEYTVSITVTPVNDDPVADATQDVSTTENDPVDVTVVATDVDGDTLSYSVETGDEPASGAVVDNGGGSFTYTPGADFTGSDAFTVTIDDGNGGVITQMVNVTVSPDSVSIDIVGPNSTTPAPVDASTDAFVYTDDAAANTDVIISGFSMDDVIQVSGATSADYNFTSGTDPNDLYVTYVDTTAGTSNLILIEDVLDPSDFVLDYDSAVTAVGYNFMTFA